jgi:hypothetical protein
LIIRSGNDGDVMEARHLEGPLPAHFRL